MPRIEAPMKTDQLPEKFWTVEDVAKFLRCGARLVYQLIEQGLPCMLLGGKYLFDPYEVYVWAKDNLEAKKDSA